MLSQRLVRRLCPHCKQPAAENAVSRRLLGQGTSHLMAVGCDKCAGVGYRGRIGIYELLSIDDTLREMIFQGKSEQAMQQYATSQQNSISAYGLTLVKNGITTLEEVLRVTVV